MSTYYTSFEIENTTDVPLILSVSDSDGNILKAGKLKPGKKSLQVAPVDAAWSLERSKFDEAETMSSPAHGSQTTVIPDNLEIESPKEIVSLLPEDSAPSEPIPYEAFLKLETGSHTARINQLLVTPDGKSLITSAENKTIRIWDVETKKQTGILLGQIGPGSDGSIQAITISRDGKYVVALAWMNPEGKYGDHDRETDVRVYDLASGNLQAGFRYPGTLQDLDFSPDGSQLVIVGNPKATIRCGYLLIYDSKDILEGFGKTPTPLASDVLYDNDTLIPSYVRFVPEKEGTSVRSRIVVATWVHRKWEQPEHTGRLIWYEHEPSTGLVRTAEREIEEQLAPNSLTLSREVAIVTGNLKKFFCYDHEGNLLAEVPSESFPAGPAFSTDENQLIVGQGGDSALVEVKVYALSFGQFQLKSTYYGHDSETVAVALLPDGTAVTAGGDQNAIHFWSTSHMEGEQIGRISGVGRVVHAVGINSDEQIGVGNRDDLRQEDGSIVLQRLFDLRSMTLRSLSTLDQSSYRRAQTQFGERELKWMEQWGYTNLWLLPDMTPFTGVPPVGWYYPSTFGFTENGTIVTGASDGKIRVAPRNPHGYYETPTRLLVGHSGRVIDHAASDKWLVTGGDDQIIRIWYIKDVEENTMTDLHPALNLFIGSDDEWVIWSKSGYYMASQNGDRYLGYHVNRGPEREALFFSSDRFRSVFLRPDIIQAIIIHGSEERASRKEAQSQLSIKSIDVAEILPPIIELDKDGVIETQGGKEGFVTFNLTVQSHGKRITRLCVLRNGRLIYVKPNPSSRKITISQLPLLPGKNRFKIFAENQDDQSHPIKSNPIEQTITGLGRYDDQDLLENGMLYILAVGVSKGTNLKNRTVAAKGDVLELSYAHKDAEAIYNMFASDNKAFEGVERTLLVNTEATLENIRRTLDEIREKINKRVEERVTNGERAKRDVLLVFLSGHGVYRRKNQQLYFWNYDFDLQQPGDTGLSFMELGEKITSLPAELVLMTDACHSGMAGSDVVKGLNPDQKGIDPNELASRIYGINESDMYIFNAARRSEYAQEGPSVEHGYFTRAILDTLAGRTDRAVTMIGLIDQVQWRVPKEKQNPVCRIYGDLLPLVIYEK